MTLTSGKVRWRVMVSTLAGERKHFNGTARNLTEARQAVREARKFKDLGELPPRDRVKVGELVDRYIEARLRDGKLAPRTVFDYRYVLAHYITPSLGTLKAQGVTGQRLRDYFDGLGEGPNGERTRAKVYDLLRASYRWGVREGLVMADPTLRGRPTASREKGAPKLMAFTPEQAVRFYNAARLDRDGYVFAFMLATGLRPGEALGLRWDDVTYEADGSATVHVRRTRSVMGGEVYEGPPKTAQGNRTVSVTGSAVQVLRDSRAEQVLTGTKRLRFGGHDYRDEGYVFSTRVGTGKRSDSLQRPMSRLCEAAGVPVLSPHKLRHTYTSVKAAEGVPIEVLSAQIGHKDTGTTQRIYRHVFESERVGLTFDPVPPAPREVRRITAKVRRVNSRPAGTHPSAAQADPSPDTE
ncbi:tyrosine-type recombinase/integrase [Deinococcus frigens]|uniref:tyrosine-type recombinase/integrase n=2 Tax=Deinococcus frigens TaxID=249403 RepID=UPI00138E549E|nr:tyrosine-type recombinase/integrase [Deinococcus frigens]